MQNMSQMKWKVALKKIIYIGKTPKNILKIINLYKGKIIKIYNKAFKVKKIF